MTNPLFPQFERALREAALREFRATRIGQLANEVARLSRGSGSRRQATKLVREITRTAKGVAKYSLGSDLGRWVSKAVGDFLKPIVNLLRGLSGGGRRPPGGGGPAAPFSPPPGEPRNPFDEEIQTAIRFLEAFGYTVTGPGRTAAPEPKSEPEQRPQDLGFRTEPPLEPGQRRVGGRILQGSENDPLYTGEMIEVESSNVHSIGFLWNDANPMQGTLKVRFLQDSRKGKGKIAGPLYYYYDVHPLVFDAFRRAGSKGGFVWDRLRIRGTVSGHRFQYELRGIAEGYLPRKATRYGNNEYFIGRRARFQSVRTGEIQEFESALPDRFVQSLETPRRGPQGFVPPDRGTPNRGGPNRGRPNRGRP